MIGSMILASAALAGATVPVEVSAPRAEAADVAFDELRAGQAQAAIQRIRANRAVEADDPSALINLGAAHARIGQTEQARGYYLAAVASRQRYDVELADGRWMDSRRAARLAIELQAKGATLALR
jgi:Flp pilus assembly protein TadD